MNDDHEAFCLTDPVFYDAPSPANTEGSLLAAIERDLPPGWETTDASVWTVVHRPDAELPAQG